MAHLQLIHTIILPTHTKKVFHKNVYDTDRQHLQKWIATYKCNFTISLST